MVSSGVAADAVGPSDPGLGHWRLTSKTAFKPFGGERGCRSLMLPEHGVAGVEVPLSAFWGLQEREEALLRPMLDLGEEQLCGHPRLPWLAKQRAADTVDRGGRRESSLGCEN